MSLERLAAAHGVARRTSLRRPAARSGCRAARSSRHTLRARTPDGRAAHATLIVASERFPVPTGGRRCFGLLVQLYSLLSTRSRDMGDLGAVPGGSGAPGKPAERAGRGLEDLLAASRLHSLLRDVGNA